MKAGEPKAGEQKRGKQKKPVFVPMYKGTMTTYGYCARCGQPVQYETDRPFVFCPYCGTRGV